MVDFAAKEGETVVILMRHEEVEKISGWKSYSDKKFGLNTPALTEKGEADAVNIGATFWKLGVEIDSVYVSPYLRTKQTAWGIVEGGNYAISKKEIKKRKRLREVQAEGIFDSGLELNRLRWPNETQNRRRGETRGDMYMGKIQKKYGYTIESPSEQAWRVRDQLAVIARENEGKVVLVVTHGEPGGYGTHQAEIGEGPMPLTFEMESMGNRMKTGHGRLLRFDQEGQVLASANLLFNHDSTELTLVERFDNREGKGILSQGERLG